MFTGMINVIVWLALVFFLFLMGCLKNSQMLEVLAWFDVVVGELT